MKRADDLTLTKVNNYLAGYIECLYVKMKKIMRRLIVKTFRN